MARNNKKKRTNYASSSGRNKSCRRDYYDNNKSEIKDLKSDKDTSKSGNDPAWYASNPILLRDAASYPFSYVTGATNIHNPAVWADSNVEGGPLNQIPGVASLHVHPTIGTSLSATDPINVASQSVYSFVRHANSGHSNYDPADLMLYILAMANMYSYLVWCQRLYGYALTYDQRNRYIPRDLIRTNNVDPDDLVNNLANFRFWINTLIAKMVSFAVPATMSVFSRMSFMYSDYYIEGTSIKEQLYQFVPDGFYQFGIDSASMGNLEWKPLDQSKLMTVDDVIKYGDTMFGAIWSQEDFGIMSGDILKAYGDNIIKLTQIPESYSMVPKFDPMVLTQIKNANLVRARISRISQSSTTGDILQTVSPLPFESTDKVYGDDSQPLSNHTTQFNAGMLCAFKDYNILTVDTDQPTPDVVIEATRLKVSFDDYKNWIKCGTEIISKVVITTEPGKDTEIPPVIVYFTNYAGDIKSLKAVYAAIEAARNFHYMPMMWCISVNDASKKVNANSYFDVDNFTILNGQDVAKLHEAAMVNMFAVPSIGKV